MLSTACPTCGAPVVLSLATPDGITCASCGGHALAPPELRQKLHAARALLFGLDVRLRQLTLAQRASLEHARRRRKLFWTISGVLLVPFALWGAGGVAAALDPFDPASEFGVGGLILTLGPLALFVFFTVVMSGQIRKRQRALEAACAARPPRIAGEPAACHVCGAPLPAAQGAIVRCAHCEADNLVAPKVLARVSAAHAAGAAALEVDLERHASATAKEAGFGSAMLFPMVIAAPLLVLVCIFVVGIPLSFIESAPSPVLRYARAPVGGDTCFARVRKERTGMELDFGTTPPEGASERRPIVDGVPYETFGFEEVIGKRVRMKDGSAGTITRAFQSFALPNDNQVEIAAPDGRLEKHEVRGLCLSR
jgi:LSD1 subclass zinc finger protein